jgi:hypothetical protein
MSAAGKNLGGIRTLADVRTRCTVDADSGCWIWQGAFTNKRSSVVPMTWFPAEHRIVPVTRLVWQLSGEDPATPSVWRTCSNKRCCSRAHLAGGTKAEWGAFVRSTGRWQGKPETAARNRQSKIDHGLAKLTPALAAMIHHSPLRGSDLAKMLGVSPSVISSVRLGKSWRGTKHEPQVTPKLYDVADLLQRVSPDRTHRRLIELPGTRQHTPQTVAAMPGSDEVTRCPGFTHDPRYQVAPGERVFGAGFAAVGIGRDITTGRPWA